MRVLEYIAKKGWDVYAKDMLSEYGPPPPPALRFIQQVATTNRFLASVPPDASLKQFAQALQQDTAMRAQIPDLDEQVNGMLRYEQAVQDAQKDPSTWKQSNGFPYPCSCHRAQGKEGWCGVAGFGVPGCEH